MTPTEALPDFDSHDLQTCHLQKINVREKLRNSGSLIPQLMEWRVTERVGTMEVTASQEGGWRPTAQDMAALGDALKSTQSDVENAMGTLLPPPGEGAARDPAHRVMDAMRYALFAGGKRLRPFLVAEAAGLFGVPRAQSLRVGTALEALHTYSLVHDDLPCMDDDDLRRGQPTVHKAYDEATAVLTGDALLTFAFEVIAEPATHPEPGVRAELALALARGAGTLGMIGGQMMDMQAADADRDADYVVYLQKRKTGALFAFACEAGAILGEAGDKARTILRDYADDFGLAFQIADDLIDLLGTTEMAGKAVGKDAEQGKATLVGLKGEAWARSETERLAQSAAARLQNFGAEADNLRCLPFYLLDRLA